LLRAKFKIWSVEEGEKEMVSSMIITRKIGFRNGYLEPVFKKQVLKDESGVFIYFIKIIRTGFV
jgi:hypothetical protein